MQEAPMTTSRKAALNPSRTHASLWDSCVPCFQGSLQTKPQYIGLERAPKGPGG